MGSLEVVWRAYTDSVFPWELCLGLLGLTVVAFIALRRPENAGRRPLVFARVVMFGLFFLAVAVVSLFGARLGSGAELIVGICFGGAYGLGLACMRAPITRYAESGWNFARLTGVLLATRAGISLGHSPFRADAYALLLLIAVSLLWAWLRVLREEKRRAAEEQRQTAAQAEQQEHADGQV